MLTCYGMTQSEDGAAPLSCEPLWLDRGCWNIKDCKYQRIKSEVSPAEDVLRVFCSRTDLCTASCACRHVLDDPSGRSSEDDGEGLQRGCCGHKPRDEGRRRGGAAGPRSVLESHPQNQGPDGETGPDVGRQPLQSALSNTHQVLQTALSHQSRTGPVLVESLC